MAQVIWHGSPNFGPRRDGLRPHLIVLHYTAMTGPYSALNRLCDPEAEVSAHYLIGADGTVWHLVQEKMRAWHAGAGAWRGWQDINSRSIGIELDNTGAQPFPEPQMQALERLLSGVLQRWAIGPEAVIAHSDMAPARKQDPGPRFDWRRLARSGLAVWPRPAAAGAGAFLADAARFGYPVPDGPEAEAQVLAAFRSRFRPGAGGPLSDADQAMIRDLADRFGVDAGGKSA